MTTEELLKAMTNAMNSLEDLSDRELTLLMTKASFLTAAIRTEQSNRDQ